MSDQIDVNQLSNALQTKVDLPAQKNQSDIDFVIESQFPTAGNNYTWYRLYKSGWVEQGGFVSANNLREISASISLIKPMSNTNYSVRLCPQSIYRSDTAAWNICIGYTILSNTNMAINSFGIGDADLQTGLSWEVKGMSSQGDS